MEVGLARVHKTTYPLVGHVYNVTVTLKARPAKLRRKSCKR